MIESPTPGLLVLRAAIKNTGALRECASIKPKYLPIRARHGRFFGRFNLRARRFSSGALLDNKNNKETYFRKMPQSVAL
jgi:hypothetical protein